MNLRTGSRMSKYKGEIINLRKQGESYDEIKNKLGCSKSTISYHCKQEGFEDIGLEKDHREKEVSDEKKEKIKKPLQRTHRKRDS